MQSCLFKSSEQVAWILKRELRYEDTSPRCSIVPPKGRSATSLKLIVFFDHRPNDNFLLRSSPFCAPESPRSSSRAATMAVCNSEKRLIVFPLKNPRFALRNYRPPGKDLRLAGRELPRSPREDMPRKWPARPSFKAFSHHIPVQRTPRWLAEARRIPLPTVLRLCQDQQTKLACPSCQLSLPELVILFLAWSCSVTPWIQGELQLQSPFPQLRLPPVPTSPVWDP
jgi:hypothetical protein